MEIEWYIGLVVVIGIAYWVFSHKCPKCKRFFAMEKTGRKEKKGFFENDLYEVQCKHCNHLEWKK